MIRKVLALVGIAVVCAAVPSRVVPTTVPALSPAPDPVLIALRSAAATRGVGQVAGPFDDRFTVSGVRVAGGVLTGDLTITSDVSDIVDLEVLAGFYDRTGRLLTTASWTRHTDGDSVGRPDEHVRFTVRGPAGAAAVRFGVPVLVNE